VLGRHGWPAAALEARLAAARLAGLRGQPDTAREYLRAASAARRGGPAALRARAWYAEALLRDSAADARGAAAAAKAGLRILDEHAAAFGATDLRVHSAAHRRDLTELGLRTAVRSGRVARIFEWAERGRASTLLFRPVRPPDDPVLAELLVGVREAAHGSPTRLAALERRVRDHCRMHGDGTGTERTDPVSLTALRAALARRVLVQYVQWDGVLHAMTLAGDRLRWHPLGAASDVTALLDRLPFALHRMAHAGVRAGSRAAAAALLRATAAGLDDLLLRPLPEIGDRPLVIVPTGALHSLPWSILPSCAGRPVSVAPSATSWHEAETRAPGERSGVLVAAGPGLTGATAEATEVATLHGTTPLADPTTTAVLDGLARTHLAHLAAHGTLSAQNPLFSSLLLADGPLVGYDLERLPRLPDTVVLAACDSGRSVVLAGDELLGLGGTFLGRGTSSLVASVIAVPDAATRTLMVALHRELAGGRCPAEALAAAQRAVPADDLAAVAAAAGFVCLGR
ncbi:MAG TPA: CHAT domain-containing protein, partial [Pseudonocardiaceae bacterium]|nr:CHAT domain-containing protein [Pseudonocardiaceae bacterium]